MLHVNRPKASDDVEDIEKEQERFLASQTPPSSAVVHKRSAQTAAGTAEVVGGPEPRRKSRFRRERDEVATRLPNSNASKFAAGDSSQTPLVCPPKCALTDLVERPGTAIYVPEAPRVEATLTAFPKATRRNPTAMSSSGPSETTSGSAPSLFMRSMGALAPPAVAQGLQSREEIDREYEAIERENKEKLAKMSPEEIAAAQRELLSRLDPKLVQFIRDRKARPRAAVQQIIKGGSQLDDAALLDLLKPPPEPAPSPSTVEFNETELPLKPSAMAQYPGMGHVEKEKLAWMTLLPSPGASSGSAEHHDRGSDPPGSASTQSSNTQQQQKQQQPFNCRFDFEGRILPADLDVPTQQALHHHGEEPERAGYTVRELANFLASAVPAQRILSLQVLANILSNHHSGKYDRCFPSGPELLESLWSCGLISLLRMALDDQSTTQISEALKTLYALLVSPHDETCLDMIYSWVDEEPYMRPAIEILPRRAPPSAEDTRGLTDEQVASQDTILGLLQMDVLARIRYLLEVCQPDSGAVSAALGILIRIARHSPEAAERIHTCPRLCMFLVTEYLPMFGWNTPQVLHGKLASTGGVPLAQALKLIRVLSESSKTVAVSLLVEHALDRTIGIYLNIDINEARLPRREVLQLQLESLRLLRVLLRHGLCADFFDDFSPTVVRQLNFTQQVSLRPQHGDPHLFDLDYASCLIACAHARLRLIVSRDQGEWRTIEPHVRAVTTAVNRWLHELIEEDGVRITAMSTLAVALRFLADAHFHRSHEVDVHSVLEALIRVAESPRWCALLDALTATSLLTATTSLAAGEGCASVRDVAALPSLASIEFAAERVIPATSERSSVFLVHSIIYFAWSALQNGTLPNARKLSRSLLSADSLGVYLARVNALPLSDTLSCPWFGRTELSLLYCAIRLRMALNDLQGENRTMLLLDLFWNASLTVLPLFGPDRSASVNHLLRQVVFNRKCYSDLPTAAVAGMSLNKSRTRGASGEEAPTECELLRSALDELDDLRQTVQDIVYFVRGSIDAKFLESHPAKSSQCEYQFTSGLLPADWMYLPLRLLYAEAMQAKRTSKPDANVNAETQRERSVAATAATMASKAPSESSEISGATQSNEAWLLRRTLEVALLIACHSNALMTRLPPLVNFIRLASVFVIDCESFLDRRISGLLAALFGRVLVPNSERCQFDTVAFRWRDLPAFTDFYASFVEQFEACSYGDTVFSAYLLLPQQRCYHADLRRLLFMEHAAALRCIGLTEEDLLGLPAKHFLEPKETEADLLLAYRAALSSKTVIQQRNQLLHMMLTHHTADT